MPIFYDPMISKLAVLAEDRPTAIARMRRALDEYLVTGIKTTLPFFAWLLEQPDFLAGRFHTTYLDDALAARCGRPFVEPGETAEDVAAVAAVLQAVLSPSVVAGGDHGAFSAATGEHAQGVRRWKTRARLDGLLGAKTREY